MAVIGPQNWTLLITDRQWTRNDSALYRAKIEIEIEIKAQQRQQAVQSTKCSESINE